MCRVTMGHLRVTIGHLRVTVGQLRANLFWHIFFLALYAPDLTVWVGMIVDDIETHHIMEHWSLVHVHSSQSTEQNSTVGVGT